MPSTNSEAIPTSMERSVVAATSSTASSVARNSASPAEAVVSKLIPSAPTSAIFLVTYTMSPRADLGRLPGPPGLIDLARRA